MRCNLLCTYQAGNDFMSGSTNRRGLLVKITTGLLVVAVVAMASVLLLNLRPGEAARAREAVVVDLASLMPGHYITTSWHGADILVIRRSQAQRALLVGAGRVDNLYEYNYMADPAQHHYFLREKESDPMRNTIGEYLVVESERQGCALRYESDAPATIDARYWQGGFYSPCEDAYFDLAGRLYAEYRERRKSGVDGGWRPSYYLELLPFRMKNSVTLVIGSS